MAKKRTTLAPKITDYTSSLAGYDLYGYENLKHQTTFFCYRFPAEHLKQAKHSLKALAYGGFLIEVWTFNYSTERQIAYYAGNPELRAKPIAEGEIGKDMHLHMASPVKDFIDQTQGLTFPTPKAHEGQDYDGH